jgi:predicted amidohydrolase YtcJ
MTVPEMTPAERELAVLAAIEDLRTKGFAEVHDLLAPAWLGPLLADLHDRGLLQVHVELFAAADAIEPLLATRKEWERDRVRLAGMKAFADGTLNSRTAWMLEPYLNPLQDHPRGTPLMTEEDLAAMFRQCREAGLGAAVHAIGDGAVRACLNAFEREPPKRLRIEHAEVIHPADVGRFASLGVVASVQPCHLLYDIEVLERELRGVLDRVLPLRSLIGAGLVPGQSLIFGSDVPIVRADPEDSILAATQRRRPPGCVAGNESAAIGKSEAIEQAEAWTCFRAAAM